MVQRGVNGGDCGRENEGGLAGHEHDQTKDRKKGRGHVLFSWKRPRKGIDSFGPIA